MAYIIGKGKFSEMEKENKRLKSELPKLIALQKEQFNTAVSNQVAKEVASLNERLNVKPKLYKTDSIGLHGKEKPT